MKKYSGFWAKPGKNKSPEQLPKEARMLNAIFIICVFSAVIAGILCLEAGSGTLIIAIIIGIVIFLLISIIIYNRLIKKAESDIKNLAQPNKLLEVVKETSEILLAPESTDLQKTLLDAMAKMARCVNAYRMYIWKNQIIKGKLQYEKQYEWVDEKIKDLYHRPDEGYFYMDTIPQWDITLSSGKDINGPVSSLSKTEQDILTPYHVVSILAIPLFLRQEFWGFVSFDDCQDEKIYSENEVSILRTGCLLMANAVVRNQNRMIIEERIRQQKLVASISKSFISKEPIRSLINKALGEMGEFLKTNRIVIATTDKESGVTRLEYSWYASKEWYPVSVDASFNETITSSFPEIIPETGFITAICIKDISSEFGGKFKFFESVGVKSLILAPVYVDGAFWGYLSVEEGSHNRTWTESDIQLVGTVTSSIAVAISRELIDRQRNDALKQAVQASMAKGYFLANMSHEMRTPMNAIIGMTSIGKNSVDISKKDYAFERIENASTHLLGVINDILDMSKIEANKFDLSPVSFDFENMLDKVISVISFRIEERRQAFTIHVDDRIPHFIVGDDQRLAQVITNLLSNAVKFTPEQGSISLKATHAGKDDEVYTIQIEVKDSGIGISKEQQDRLFTSFEQADSGTSRKFGGTGLGLAISKRIVELMGGQIWIESELEKGSSFFFTIQVRKGHGAHTGMLAPGIHIGNMRILVVDDDLDILEFFSDIMARLNINCDTAANEEETTRKIENSGGYDLYFVDWNMPGMNGVDLTRKIKSHRVHKAVNPDEEGIKKPVVIMISALEWYTIEEEARDAGVDKFLSKPLFPSTIVDTINKCLGSSGTQEAKEKAPSEATENFEGHTILLVEDVEINQEIVITLLEPTSLKIETAENGREAVEKFALKPEKYSMVFMDVQMPEMDGYEATRRIRSMNNEWAQRIPIVAMTANVFREDVERCLSSGMNDHVGKPLNIKDVMAMLKKYLPKRA